MKNRVKEDWWDRKRECREGEWEVETLIACPSRLDVEVIRRGRSLAR